MSYHEGTEYGEKYGYGKQPEKKVFKKGDKVDCTFKRKKLTNKAVRHVDSEAEMIEVQLSEFTSVWLSFKQVKLSNPL